jgi:hypothetical protein
MNLFTMMGSCFFLFEEELYKNRFDWYVLTFIFTRAQEKRYNSRILTARNCVLYYFNSEFKKKINKITKNTKRQPFFHFYWFCL